MDTANQQCVVSYVISFFVMLWRFFGHGLSLYTKPLVCDILCLPWRYQTVANFFGVINSSHLTSSRDYYRTTPLNVIANTVFLPLTSPWTRYIVICTFSQSNQVGSCCENLIMKTACSIFQIGCAHTLWLGNTEQQTVAWWAHANLSNGMSRQSPVFYTDEQARCLLWYDVDQRFPGIQISSWNIENRVNKLHTSLASGMERPTVDMFQILSTRVTLTFGFDMEKVCDKSWPHGLYLCQIVSKSVKLRQGQNSRQDKNFERPEWP